MQKYESMVVISTKQDEEAIKGLVEKFSSLISANGTLVSVDEWGKKKLAYEVQKMKEAYYYFIQFDAETTAPAEIESRIRIMDNVIRYLCVRQDA